MKKLSLALLLSVLTLAPLVAVDAPTVPGQSAATSGTGSVQADTVGLTSSDAVTPTPEVKLTPEQQYAKYMEKLPMLQAKLAKLTSNPEKMAMIQQKLAALQAKYAPKIAKWQSKGLISADSDTSMPLTALTPATTTESTDATA